MLLRAELTCWRVEVAARAAFLLDMADYFTAAKLAMSQARRSVHLLNWAFDPDTLFNPEPGCVGAESDRFGHFLIDLARGNRDLDVRLLCWQSAVAATQHFPILLAGLPQASPSSSWTAFFPSARRTTRR